MSIEQAREVVARIQRDNGFGADPSARPPASIAEVREIVRTDQLDRYAQAREYAARLTGVDALALRASLEVLWADALLTVADLFRETSHRALADIRTLEATRETMDSEAADRLIAEKQEQLDKANEANEALRVLSEPHLNAALELAKEAQRQSPQAVVGYIPGAHAELLKRSWNDFDRQIRKAETLSEAPTPYMHYLRALEQALRFGQREKARQTLEEVLVEAPELTRARSRLILLEDTPDGRYAHLEQLKQRSPRHPIVMMAGPAIEREYQTSRDLRAETPAEPVPALEPETDTDDPAPDALPPEPSDAPL